MLKQSDNGSANRPNDLLRVRPTFSVNAAPLCHHVSTHTPTHRCSETRLLSTIVETTTRGAHIGDGQEKTKKNGSTNTHRDAPKTKTHQRHFLRQSRLRPKTRKGDNFHQPKSFLRHETEFLALVSDLDTSSRHHASALIRQSGQSQI